VKGSVRRVAVRRQSKGRGFPAFGG
jgi:hypothetical protein